MFFNRPSPPYPPLKTQIMTTRPTGGLHKGYKPKGYRPASKGAGFHSVQARPLTRRHPLKGICTTCHP